MCNNNAEESVGLEHFVLNCIKFEEARSIIRPTYTSMLR